MQATNQRIVQEADTKAPNAETGMRDGLRAIWDSVAGGWEEHADFIDQRGSALTERMIAAAELQPPRRVLELACGPGGLGLRAAELLGAGSEIVLSDVAPQMTAIARDRAEKRDLRNVTARDLDLEEIDEPDDSFDAVLCREGLMLVVDPQRAAREIRRVLRPAGRAVIAVWAERARNPWLGRVFDAVSDQLGAPFPPPGIPQPFSLGAAGQLDAVMEAAGFSEVRVEEVEVSYRGPSFEDWWQRTTALAGPLRNMLAAMDENTLAELAGRARAGVREFETADGLDIPGVSRVAVASC